jgi:ferritin-like metal-binding protein YciE
MTTKKKHSAKDGHASQYSSSTSNEGISLKTLFQKELGYAYSCEKQLVDALGEMAKACENEELQDAFTKHQQETQRHVERLEKIHSRLQVENQEESCEVITSLIESGKKVIEEYAENPTVRDSAIIIIAQKVEHFEIALYGSLYELADVLGYNQAADLLERTLKEEKQTDKTLTEIAYDINDQAYEMSEQHMEKSES